MTGHRVRNAADAVTMGAALGALVAADTPALEELQVGGNHLGDGGMRPLCDALPRNTHLHTLEVDKNSMSVAFVRQQLHPVRANISLLRMWRMPTIITEERPAEHAAMTEVSAITTGQRS